MLVVIYAVCKVFTFNGFLWYTILFTSLQIVDLISDSPWPVEEQAPLWFAYAPQPNIGLSPTRPSILPGIPPTKNVVECRYGSFISR